jgi:capsule biosynthesis phosphatase
MRIVFDIDETLTIKQGPDYTIDSLPDKEMIEIVNQLYDSGNTIVLYTARKMESSGHNVGLAIAKGAPNTFKWLEKYSVKYHEIFFGKPNGDIYIDDKAFGYERENVLNYLKTLLPRVQFVTAPKEGRLTVLRLVDQWNWAYDHIAREQAKYSRHNIITRRLLDMTSDDLKGVDVLYIPGPNMGKNKSDLVIADARRNYPNCRIVCGYAGEHEILYPDADVIVAISAKFLPRLKQMYQGRKTPIVFLPESADTEFFTPAANFPKNFTVGWSGRVAEVKRCHLLDKLPYPVQKQSDHGKEFFKTPGRSLQPMKDFYQSLSVLVLTSSSECMPRVVLEAMACGLPVISTEVGSLKMIMEKDWLVPVNPEQVVVQEMSKKLKLLATSPELAKAVGQRNRQFISEYFSWKTTQPMWDSFFDEVSKKHYQSVLIYNQQYRDKYAHLEPSLKT